MTETLQKVEIAAEVTQILSDLGMRLKTVDNNALKVSSPIDGQTIAEIAITEREQRAVAVRDAHEAFLRWREVPGPRRGELVRLFGEELRKAKTALARLVTIEAGKITTEGLGEVQEMIDICDFAVGLSRQLYGLTITSERSQHRMMEMWNPLGVVGIISAFNFPVAVWAWNAALAVVCGNSMVWKPSEKTPLCALACQALFERACARFGEAPPNLSCVILGGSDAAVELAENPAVRLVSATGSTKMGSVIGPRVAARFGRSILELGGNNGGIVCQSADLDLTLTAVAFGAMGTAGQRCTTLRRLFVHEAVYDTFLERLKRVYSAAPVGDPRDSRTLIGPLIDARAFEAMRKSLEEARRAGGMVHGGERVTIDAHPDGFYVKPALVEMPSPSPLLRTETFAPILYVLSFRSLDDAIHMHNDVPQGLSSSIFTTDLRESEIFMSAIGSDCGIVNVNIGPSGAEIGGAFGGEKDTGGGREAGSDSWKSYMRRVTTTINFAKTLSLSQGVVFEVA
ncbi:MAG: aldehyde dehydrogenase family protein [Vulcanimicrobiaceae bacterium]|jgi:aldehyde dehydrogenase (NAD+)